MNEEKEKLELEEKQKIIDDFVDNTIDFLGLTEGTDKTNFINAYNIHKFIVNNFKSKIDQSNSISKKTDEEVVNNLVNLINNHSGDSMTTSILFMNLAKKINLDCRLVRSYKADDVNKEHVSNIVLIDNKYYIFDTVEDESFNELMDEVTTDFDFALLNAGVGREYYNNNYIIELEIDKNGHSIGRPPKNISYKNNPYLLDITSFLEEQIEKTNIDNTKIEVELDPSVIEEIEPTKKEEIKSIPLEVELDPSVREEIEPTKKEEVEIEPIVELDPSVIEEIEPIKKEEVEIEPIVELDPTVIEEIEPTIEVPKKVSIEEKYNKLLNNYPNIDITLDKFKTIKKEELKLAILCSIEKKNKEEYEELSNKYTDLLETPFEKYILMSKEEKEELVNSLEEKQEREKRFKVLEIKYPIIKILNEKREELSKLKEEANNNDSKELKRKIFTLKYNIKDIRNSILNLDLYEDITDIPEKDLDYINTELDDFTMTIEPIDDDLTRELSNTMIIKNELDEIEEKYNISLDDSVLDEYLSDIDNKELIEFNI